MQKMTNSRFCPFAKGECREDCALFLNEEAECSIEMAANSSYKIYNGLGGLNMAMWELLGVLERLEKRGKE